VSHPLKRGRLLFDLCTSIGNVKLARISHALFYFTIAFVCGILAPAQSWAQEYWNQYRGPNGDGTCSLKGLPTIWSNTEHVRWKVPLEGKAWSSPVVWDQQVWLTNATEDGKRLSVVCLDLATGKVVHNKLVYEIEDPQFCIERNSYASPTPVVEKDRIYLHYGAHGTKCLDTNTTEVIWSRQDLPCNHHRGPASSPIVWEDLLILTFDGFDLQYVVALNKATGETVWKTERKFEYGSDNGDVMKAYGTPTVIDTGKRWELISPSAGATAAYDPRTGTELWRVQSGGMNASGRPVALNGTAFVGTADGGFQFFAVNLGGEGDVTGSHLAWKLTKGYPRYSSPIVAEGLLYMANEQGVITCVEPESGKVVWQRRVGGLFMPSPVFADGKLYFLTEEGTCHVLAPGREFNSLATNTLDGGFMASPAIADKCLILRSKNSVYCIAE
jgi:outer membrane protein assembly factor BamB